MTNRSLIIAGFVKAIQEGQITIDDVRKDDVIAKMSETEESEE